MTEPRRLLPLLAGSTAAQVVHDLPVPLRQRVRPPGAEHRPTTSTSATSSRPRSPAAACSRPRSRRGRARAGRAAVGATAGRAGARRRRGWPRRRAGGAHARSGPPTVLTFKAVPPNRLDALVVPNGYDQPSSSAGATRCCPARRRSTCDHQTAAAQVEAVRLQQRLRRGAAARRGTGPRAARGQPRVHQRGPDVPAASPAADALTASRSRSRWRRTACRWWRSSGSATPAQWRWSRGGRRRYNRRITALTTDVRVHRPGRRQRRC